MRGSRGHDVTSSAADKPIDARAQVSAASTHDEIVSGSALALQNSMSGNAANLVQAASVIGNIVFEAPPVAVHVPRQLRRRPRYLVGRDDALRELDRLLAEPWDSKESLCVVLHGPPGVGKTALALEWAHRNRERFDGDLFADFHDHDLKRPASCEEVFDSFLRGLGVPASELPGSLDSQIAAFNSLVADRHLLVVLDNVASEERVRPFLAGSGVTVLVTSRDQLRGLRTRDGVISMSVDTLQPEDAAGLLSTLVGEGRIAAEREAAQRLASLCAYLPIALTIAGEQVSARPSLTIREHVGDLIAEGGLEVLSVGRDERAQLRAVFSWSYHALRPASALTFRRLGLHPGRDFGTEAITALSGLSGRDTREAIQELLSVSLLTEPAAGRYALLDLLRQYALDTVRRVEAVATQDATTRELIDWYVATVDNANVFMTPGLTQRDDVDRRTEGRDFGSFDEALHWLDDERSNLIDITRRASELGEFHAAAVMPNLLWSYYNLTKHWAEWIETNNLGLTAARRSGDRKSEAYLLTSQGVAYRNLRQTDTAIDHHRRAIELFEQIGENLGLGYAQQNLANVLSDAGRFEEALTAYRQALEVFESVEAAPRGRGVTLNSMAVCYCDMGEFDQALDAAAEARSIMEQIGDEHGIAFALHSSGRARAGSGQLSAAVTDLIAAIQLRRRIDDRYGAGRSLVALGDAYTALDRPADARGAWLEALALFDELDAPERSDVQEKLDR